MVPQVVLALTSAVTSPGVSPIYRRGGKHPSFKQYKRHSENPIPMVLIKLAPTLKTTTDNIRQMLLCFSLSSSTPSLFAETTVPKK